MLEQLPVSALDGDMLARSDSAGASHDLADACRETQIRFSFGYPLTDPGTPSAARPSGVGVAARDREGQPAARGGVGDGADRPGEPCRLA